MRANMHWKTTCENEVSEVSETDWSLNSKYTSSTNSCILKLVFSKSSWIYNTSFCNSPECKLKDTHLAKLCLSATAYDLLQYYKHQLRSTPRPRSLFNLIIMRHASNTWNEILNVTIPVQLVSGTMNLELVPETTLSWQTGPEMRFPFAQQDLACNLGRFAGNTKRVTPEDWRSFAFFGSQNGCTFTLRTASLLDIYNVLSLMSTSLQKVELTAHERINAVEFGIESIETLQYKTFQDI